MKAVHLSTVEERFMQLVRYKGLPEPRGHYAVDELRRYPLWYSFDFAWPEYRIGINIEGQSWTSKLDDGQTLLGRHQALQHFEEDCRFYNKMTLAGWRWLRFSVRLVESGEAVDICEKALQHTEWRVEDG